VEISRLIFAYILVLALYDCGCLETCEN